MQLFFSIKLTHFFFDYNYQNVTSDNIVISHERHIVSENEELFNDGINVQLKFMFSKKATKNYKIFHRWFDTYYLSKRQIDGEDFVIFCGLLRKHELYTIFF